MKIYIVLFLLLGGFKTLKANRIDSLQNEADVQKFIISVDSNIRRNLDRWPIIVLSKQEMLVAVDYTDKVFLPVPSTWTKADLNGDGKTDLIAYTKFYGVLIVMDTGNNIYKVCRIKSFPTVPIVAAKGNGTYTVLLAEHNDCRVENSLNKAHGSRPDTLIYRFGQFVELNNHPANYEIESVTILTGLCALGRCPSYKLIIEANGKARYVSGSEMVKQGVFTEQLALEKTKKIFDLVNLMKVKDMQDRYQPGCIFDGGGWQLTVTFKNSPEKTISDFNGGGTFGLEAIYVLMDDIAKTQTWKQIK